jgi:hypothetical protein
LREEKKVRIYHSGVSLRIAQKYSERYPKRKISVLLSYGRPNPEKHAICVTRRNLFNSVIYDSGAYTLNYARIQDINITLSAYTADLRQNAHYYDWYINLDEDFSEDGFEVNWWNQSHIEEAGFNPVPVIHDLKGPETDFYIERGYRRVAIGSSELGRGRSDALRSSVHKLYDAGAKVHFLGAVNFNLLASMPVHSCDSSNWNQKGSRGAILWWNPEKEEADKTDKIHVIDHEPLGESRIYLQDYQYRRELEEYLQRELGLTYRDLMGRDRLVNRSLTYIHYCMTLEEMINQRHQENGFRFD